MASSSSLCCRHAGGATLPAGSAEEHMLSPADSAQDARTAAGDAVAGACALGAWSTAVQGVQLLLPGCPLEGCLRLLQVPFVLRLRDHLAW